MYKTFFSKTLCSDVPVLYPYSVWELLIKISKCMTLANPCRRLKVNGVGNFKKLANKIKEMRRLLDFEVLCTLLKAPIPYIAARWMWSLHLVVGKVITFKQFIHMDTHFRKAPWFRRNDKVQQMKIESLS